jgi:hypothetical protein
LRRIADVSAQHVVIRDHRGEHRLRFDERSFVRRLSRRSARAINAGDERANGPRRYRTGWIVIAAFEDDHVINLRRQA